MHLTVILRITGSLLTLFSFAFLMPVAVALFYGESTLETFFTAFAITLLSGLILWLPLRGKRELRGGDGFCVRTRESTISRQRHRLGGDHAKVVRAQGASRIQCVRQRIQLFARYDVNFHLTSVLDERG